MESSPTGTPLSFQPYLQAAIPEALRVFPGVPLYIPSPLGVMSREAQLTDDMLQITSHELRPKAESPSGGRVRPEGPTLPINPWVIHNSKDIWSSGEKRLPHL